MEYTTSNTNKDGFHISGNMLKALVKMEFQNAEVAIDDETYIICDLDWITKQFSPYFKTKTVKYSKKFDCEDFVRMFKVETQLSHNASKSKIQSPIIAEIHFVQRVSEVDDIRLEYRHAINMILVVTEESFAFMFYEPIESKFISLTNEQISSIYYIRF